MIVGGRVGRFWSRMSSRSGCVLSRMRGTVGEVFGEEGLFFLTL